MSHIVYLGNVRANGQPTSKYYIDARHVRCVYLGADGHTIQAGPAFDSVSKSAEFSFPDRLFRYTLTRTWDRRGTVCAFIGLNPSTADASQDDPTVRRCIGFARRWGHGSLVMLNLYAYRSTDPRGLWAPGVSPIGPDNDRHLLTEAKRAATVVAAWGVNPDADRVDAVVRLLTEAGVTLMCLEEARGGAPRHPLYLKGDLLPRVWREPA